MKYKISISLDQEIINFIENESKGKPISTFINEILKEWVEYRRGENNNRGN